MKKYKNWQKSLSFFCIFSILFLQTVQLPFLMQASADTGSYRDLVSVIVNSSIYTESLATQIKTYSQDIQSAYPGVQLVVFPVDSQITPHDIALLNEKLYNE